MKHKIVFLITFFWTTIGISQEISKDLYLKMSIRQDNQHFQFKVLENTLGNEYNYKQHKFYYWFKSQTVVCTQGAASGQLLHGFFESFYDNKQLSSKGLFNKGLKHGSWTYWNQKGLIFKTETWDNGEKRGEEKYFDDQGRLLTTIDYGFKTIQRVSKDSIIYTTKVGIYKKVILLDSVGNEVKEIQYKNGKPVVNKPIKVKEKHEKTKKLKKENKLRFFFKRKEKSTINKKVEKNEKKRLWKRWFSKNQDNTNS
jgi:hypothetical protein